MKWDDGISWGQACGPFPYPLGPCKIGVHYPGPDDVAVIGAKTGFSSTAGTCKDLYIVSAGRTDAALSGGLTIEGRLLVVDNSNITTANIIAPTINLFNPGAAITFTGAKLSDPSAPVVSGLGNSSPFPQVFFDPGTGKKLNIGPIVVNSMIVKSGIVELGSGAVISGAGATPSIDVMTAATLNVLGAVNGDGSPESLFASVKVGSTASVATGSSGYVNASSLELESGSVLNVGFSGPDQTSGWFYQGHSPATLTISPEAEIRYSASGPQNVYATSYGHLSLTAPTGQNTIKTLSGNGLGIRGNLVVGSGTTFSPALSTTFTNSTANTISGEGTVKFDGGMLINKPSGRLTLSKELTISQGINVQAGELNLGNGITTLSSGDIINNGRISNSGRLEIRGKTIVSGNGTTALGGLVVGDTVTLNPGSYISGNQIWVSKNAVFNVLGGVCGTSGPTSGIVTFNIGEGATVTTGSSGYVNARIVSVGPDAKFNIGFSGVDQTQGWWYQSSAPASVTINNTSTVSYNADGVQNVASRNYGNLSLTSSLSATKTLVGGGSLIISGNLAVGANVTFSPASRVTFIDSDNNIVSGDGTLNFNGGLTINKPSGTLTLSKATTISGGISVEAGELNLGNIKTTLSSGNIVNNGPITSGAAAVLEIATGAKTTVSGTGTMSLNDLIVNGEMNFNSSATVFFTGDITNNGAISFPLASSVNFKGSNAQSVSGNAFSVGNMVVEKRSNSILSNNTDVELYGVLTMKGGTFDADGNGSGIFTLNSDASGDASIGSMGAGTLISGEVTYERYFDNGKDKWRHIGFPVTGVELSELSSCFTVSKSSVAWYDETALGDVDQGWNLITGGTLPDEVGYTAFVATGAAPVTVKAKGPLKVNTPRTGDYSNTNSWYTFPVTYTGDASQLPSQNGWNMLANPYASPISWNLNNAAAWSGYRMASAAAIWDSQNAVYRYSNVDWNGVIASGQAFWVQTTAVPSASNPVLRCSDQAKVTDANPSYYRQGATASRLLITLTGNAGADVTAVRFNDEATAEFDNEFDAHKLQNGIFNVSTLSEGGLNLAANTLPFPSTSSRIKLNITNINPGMYALSFAGIASFQNMDSVILVDKFLRTSKLVLDSSVYRFSVTDDKRSMGQDRFELKFHATSGRITDVSAESSSKTVPTGELSESFVYPNPVHAGSELHIRVPSSAKNCMGKIVIQSCAGAVVKRVDLGNGDNVKSIDMTGIEPGMYILFIVDNAGTSVKFKLIVK